MSTTTTAPSQISVIETAVIGTLPGIIGMAFANKLTGVSTTVQTTVGTLDAEAEAAVTKLQGELDSLEMSSPLVQDGIAAFHSIAKAVGFALPAEDAVFAGVKAAINDVLLALKAPAA